jgi:N-acetylmannosamine-6-phosphate 2-epimerase/N-acetylmannosamine kinase
VGGALNDPVKQTRALLQACRTTAGPVGAVDLGGTWLRFGTFDERWQMQSSERIETPADPQERLAWIRARARESGVRALGIGTGGVVDPDTGTVWRSKPLIPDHEGTVFRFDIPTYALNDGLATAWGHACHPLFAGTRVATIALGTGVGFGVVERGRLLMGARGEPPHLNDVPTPWGSFESLLGGYALGVDPSPAQIASAREAGVAAIRLVHGLFHPDHIVVCGGVGLGLVTGSDPMLDGLPSPFGQDAGLYGAAALALWPG